MPLVGNAPPCPAAGAGRGWGFAPDPETNAISAATPGVHAFAHAQALVVYHTASPLAWASSDWFAYVDNIPCRGSGGVLRPQRGCGGRSHPQSTFARPGRGAEPPATLLGLEYAAEPPTQARKRHATYGILPTALKSRNPLFDRLPVLEVLRANRRHDYGRWRGDTPERPL